MKPILGLKREPKADNIAADTVADAVVEGGGQETPEQGATKALPRDETQAPEIRSVRPIRKAVITAGGLGAEFLPATKAQPKEMLPIINTPVIQLVVEEAVEAGITDIIIIIGKGKRAIEDHFDRSFELEYELKRRGMVEMLHQVNRLHQLADIHFIRQNDAAGLGAAILRARDHCGDEPFAVLLGDTVVTPSNFTKKLMDLYAQEACPIIGACEVVKDDVSRYGIIAGEPVTGDAQGTLRVTDLVEKPSPAEAPSTMAIAGRYILTPDIFDALAQTRRDRSGQVQLTDALAGIAKKQKVLARVLDGKRYDIGSRKDYVQAVVDFARSDPQYLDIVGSK